MKKSVILVITLLLVSTVTFGQIDYGSNSGKQKAKAAKKEAKAAKNDEAFQLLMNEGHELFSDNQFEKALEKYETASNKRPINVYPRVKIADVQLAMMNYVEEPEVEEPLATRRDEPEVKTEDETTQKERIDEALEKEEAKITDSLPPPPADIIEIEEPEVELPIVKVETDIKKMTVDEFSEELGESYPDGVTEEIINENGKKITRRVVVKNGKGADYRKVEHRWGGVFYFKNDEAISVHTWNMETVLD